ncbi:DEDD exonuclease domain-containing protein [Millisia brevis]|uniref:DEDD exonuclease domain-containing protein n=1 Tax=Millisia brevis TaxID=264148 RepID=UPI003F6EE985
MTPGAQRRRDGGQLAFDDLDESLFHTTFVVVDLETTGGSPTADAITEIGAVKVRGGEVIGELATLVDPQRAVPVHITELTGIDTAMVVGAPRIEQVLPSFLEFARGAVLVAHNARFDIAFLTAAAGAMGLPWPKPRVLCTVRLARRVLTRDEAPSVRLSALSRLLRARTEPNHRALADARATVDVLHALLERVGNQGVHSYAELVDYLPAVGPRVRSKRFLAADLPAAPGVYLFRGPGDEVLYVGTSTDLRRRVRTYFTGSETRGRMREMVELAQRVDHVECAHSLEAAVRELQLISAHQPPYNRRSKRPRRGWWVAPTDERLPRLRTTRTPEVGGLGPFRDRAAAADIAALLSERLGLRTCRTSPRSMAGHRCPTAPVGGCPAVGRDDEQYRAALDAFAALVAGTDDAVLADLVGGLDRLVAGELFESAARLRDRVTVLTRTLGRLHGLAALAQLSELVAARPVGGGWEFAVIRYGRLASAGVAPVGVAPMPVVELLTASARTIRPDDGPLRGATVEEVAILRRWILTPGTRIVRSEPGYLEPIRSAERRRAWCDRAAAAASIERERDRAD